MKDLTLRCYRSVHEIDPGLWDGILPPGEFYHSHRFVCAVEDAKVEDAVFWYLLFFDGEELIATAALSAFEVSLDLFLGDSGLIRWINQKRPRFFKIRVLLCGLPASFGQKNLAIKDPTYNAKVLDGLTAEMDRIAKAERIRYQGVKEVFEHQLPMFEGLNNHGFFRGYSIPYMHLDLHADSFPDYLASLRSHYRRKIKLSLKKIANPDLDLSGPIDPGDWNPRLVMTTDLSAVAPGDFHAMYLDVMSRAETKLETLNRAFFEQLYRHMASDIRLIYLADGERVYCAGILMGHGKDLIWMLVGRNGVDEHDSYFNLVYGILKYAGDNGYRKLHLGQTAYWVKQRVGGYPEDEFLYFKGRNPLLHHTLKLLRAVVFPKLKIKPINVFKA